MSAIELLLRWGDPLEVAIARTANGELDAILQPYAEVWGRHIFGRRRPDAPGRVPDDWMPFAGSHYTALIRSFSAWRHAGALRSLCTREVAQVDGALLLTIQDESAAFWWNVGSALDNLGWAIASFPESPHRNAGKDYFTNGGGYLRYAYVKRTQFIHSRLVPVGVDGGMPFLHYEFLRGERGKLEEAPDVTDWSKAYTRKQLLDEFYETEWQAFLKELSGAWWKLVSELAASDKGPTRRVPSHPAEFQGELGFFTDPDGPRPPSYTEWNPAPPTPKVQLPDIPPSG